MMLILRLCRLLCLLLTSLDGCRVVIAGNLGGNMTSPTMIVPPSSPECSSGNQNYQRKNCSHICSHNWDGKEGKCGCPEGLHLGEDGLTCSSCLPGQFECEDGSCILSSFVCDGDVDCGGDGGEDEQESCCGVGSSTTPYTEATTTSILDGGGDSGEVITDEGGGVDETETTPDSEVETSTTIILEREIGTASVLEDENINTPVFDVEGTTNNECTENVTQEGDDKKLLELGRNLVLIFYIFSIVVGVISVAILLVGYGLFRKNAVVYLHDDDDQEMVVYRRNEKTWFNEERARTWNYL